MPAWQNNYESVSGMKLGFNDRRPAILDTSRIIIYARIIRGWKHIDLDITTECSDLPLPLSETQIKLIKSLLGSLRTEANRTIDEIKTETAQDGILYVTRALQVRMNQHWHATQANKEVSVEELLGMLTVKDDDAAAESVQALMESLTITDDKDEAMEDVAGDDAAAENASAEDDKMEA